MKVGLALGGGGAKGLAHIPMLEVLDELELRPCAIVGTSTGAVIGSLYASGLAASEIHAGVQDLMARRWWRPGGSGSGRRVRWLDLVALERGRGGLVNVDRFLDELASAIRVETFEELEIPLKVVAADFWRRQEVILDSGPIIPAVRASMALPGLFRPVVRDGRVLVDGGTVNPVPFDLVPEECDVVVAINVLGRRGVEEASLPGLTEALFNTFQIMQTSILREKLRRSPPTVWIEPDIVDVRVLDFGKAEQIFEQSAAAQEELREALADVLPARPAR